MPTASTLHQEAMNRLHDAQAARRKRRYALHKLMLSKAYQLEREAAYLLQEKFHAEPTRSILFRSAATLALECGEPREAEKLVIDALAKTQNVPPGIKLELLEVFAVAGEPQNLPNPDALRLHYEHALAIYPGEADRHNELAILLEEQFEEYTAARSHYERALLLDAEHTAARYNLALLLKQHLNSYATARMHLEQVLMANPQHAAAHNALAIILVQCYKEYAAAKQHYEQALIINPEYADAEYNLAILLGEHLGFYKNARAHYERAIELAPDYGPAYYNLSSLILRYFDNIEYAQFYYLKACSLDPTLKTSYRDVLFKLPNKIVKIWQLMGRATTNRTDSDGTLAVGDSDHLPPWLKRDQSKESTW